MDIKELTERYRDRFDAHYLQDDNGTGRKGRKRKKEVETRTEAQKQTLIDLLTILRGEYPDAIIQGHRDFSPDVNGDGIITPDEFIKDCPCFDAKKEYAKI